MKKVLIFLGIIAVALIGAYAYFGGFSSVTVNNVTRDQKIAVYVTHTGCYKKMNDDMMPLYKNLEKTFGPDAKNLVGFGIYLDNPETVKSTDLRSIVGYFISEDQAKKLKDETFHSGITVIPSYNAISVPFTYRGMPSFIIGVMRAYPALDKFIMANPELKWGSSVEIYDLQNHQVFYDVPTGESFTIMMTNLYTKSVLAKPSTAPAAPVEPTPAK